MMPAEPSLPSPHLVAALDYLARGWPVFPVCRPVREGRCVQHGNCEHAGKVPLVKWQALQTDLPTEAEVREWWSRYRTANIGMATGALSGVIVLDTDSSDARKEALRLGVPKTRAVWTGKPGGAHYHLRHPGVAVRNFARKLPGMDFRGDGGYVLLPPSHHAQGADYRWVEGTEDCALAEPPDWLMELLQGAPAATTEALPGEGAEPLDLRLILDGIPQGQRDDLLYRYACKLRGDDVPQTYAEMLIRQAARLCQPPFDEDLAAEKIVRVYRAFPANLTLDLSGVPTAEQAPSLEPGAIDESATEPWLVYDAETYLARDLPTVEWRIEGFVREGAIVWVFGAPGTIKTYIATDGGLAVASGGTFLGQFPCTQGKVLVVEEDTLDSDYQQVYLRPLVEARGLSPSALREWLFVAPPAGMRLDDGTRLRELADWLERERPALVILDAFYLLHMGDGYGKELRRIVDILRRLRGEYGASIWIIDHDRKGGESRDGENPIDRLFGGREKSAGCDAVLEVLPVKGSPGVVELHTLKLRGAKPHPPLTITLQDGRLLAEGATPHAPKGATEQLYMWLRREGGSRTKAQMQRGTALSERAVGYALSELRQQGLVQKAGKSGQADTWIALSEPQEVPW